MATNNKTVGPVPICPAKSNSDTRRLSEAELEKRRELEAEIERLDKIIGGITDIFLDALGETDDRNDYQKRERKKNKAVIFTNDTGQAKAA